MNDNMPALVQSLVCFLCPCAPVDRGNPDHLLASFVLSSQVIQCETMIQDCYWYLRYTVGPVGETQSTMSARLSQIVSCILGQGIRLVTLGFFALTTLSTPAAPFIPLPSSWHSLGCLQPQLSLGTVVPLHCTILGIGSRRPGTLSAGSFPSFPIFPHDSPRPQCQAARSTGSNTHLKRLVPWHDSTAQLPCLKPPVLDPLILHNRVHVVPNPNARSFM